MKNIDKINNIARRVVLENRGGSLNLANNITKKNIAYSKPDTFKIITAYLERNNYVDDVVDKVLDIHPDKPILDIYYSKKYKVEDQPIVKETEPTKQEVVNATSTNETYNCGACAMLLATGEENKYNGIGDEGKGISTSKLLILSGVGLLLAFVGATIIMSENKS